MDGEAELHPQTVLTNAQPMIYVTKEVSMDSEDIGRAMGEAFETLGTFIGANQIAVAGPPLAIYYDYSENGMKLDVGFPVPAPALAQAKGDIRAGASPSGRALKFVHRGPYDNLRATYGEIEAYYAAKGIPMSPVCWEVYISDPDTTPAEDLVTEIFMKQTPTS